MSVLITGMAMPESCERCPMLDWDLAYIKCKATGRHFKMTECWRCSRVSDCPLVPVPPHGRLIDADALAKDGWRVVLRTKTASSENLEGIMEEYMRLDSVRTVIPAEEVSE